MAVRNHLPASTHSVPSSSVAVNHCCPFMPSTHCTQPWKQAAQSASPSTPLFRACLRRSSLASNLTTCCCKERNQDVKEMQKLRNEEEDHGSTRAEKKTGKRPKSPWAKI
ncbi:hypothetical protein M0R45_036006 [Rubus argutus]|uniref:Uncharacterized protein n=1 Tax=Rubus argutus TaxID=59490 RepID=A0AAW1VYI3_RUBAR